MSTYHRLLREDPDLTMPVAAIEALVELLAHAQASTVSETLDLLQKSTEHLKSRVPNPISLSAGTDLFQRYLINALQRPGSGSSAAMGLMAMGAGAGAEAAGDFQSIRLHLINNGRLFVTRAKASRDKIAAFGRHFVRDGTTVLTNGASRVVGALLRHAARDSQGSVRFRVIYVLRGGGGSSSSSSMNPTTAGNGEGRDYFSPRHEEAHTTNSNNNDNDVGQSKGSCPHNGLNIIRALRERGVPVAVIGEGAVGYAMEKVDMVIVGAEGVVENGGIISRLGTYQIGLLAKAARKPFYVVAESHKFVRLYPLGQYDLPIEQKIIEFTTATGDPDESGRGSGTGGVFDGIDGVVSDGGNDEGETGLARKKRRGSVVAVGPEDAVDFTVSFWLWRILEPIPFAPLLSSPLLSRSLYCLICAIIYDQPIIGLSLLLTFDNSHRISSPPSSLRVASSHRAPSARS